jgi:hypothetical protein
MGGLVTAGWEGLPMAGSGGRQAAAVVSGVLMLLA